MSTKRIIIPDIGDVSLYKRRGARRLVLSVRNSGEVRVTMPPWLPYKAGEEFARARASWIAAHRPAVDAKLLRHGQSIGKAHRLHFESSPDLTSVSTRIVGNVVRVHHPPHLNAESPEVQRAARASAVRALRKEAEALLPQRLQTLAEQTGLAYHGVGIKQLKSRWGSCTADKHITLNLFLMQLPWHLIDYVLVHELTHTKVMRHGPPFWQEFEKHVPQAKRLRAEIRAFQPYLE